MRSYLWLLPSFKSLAAEPNVVFVKRDSCVFGSSRYKPTGFLTNMPSAVRELGLRCKGGGEKVLCDRKGLPHPSWDTHSSLSV